MFCVPLDTKYVTSERIFPANLIDSTEKQNPTQHKIKHRNTGIQKPVTEVVLLLVNMCVEWFINNLVAGRQPQKVLVATKTIFAWLTIQYYCYHYLFVPQNYYAPSYSNGVRGDKAILQSMHLCHLLGGCTVCPH